MYTVVRRIEIDAGHRVPDHKSKCAALHGHRYVIEVGFCGKRLQETGEEKGMVKDFSFMKELLMKSIHDVFDHKLMLYVEDPILECFFNNNYISKFKERVNNKQFISVYSASHSPTPLPIVICNFVPTAENLAKAWWITITESLCTVDNKTWAMFRSSPAFIYLYVSFVRVYETPNCIAEYQPDVE
ncbi:MAG: hypothetical protein GWN01_09395 [Nitrosopumilaceae archaeon]|nr:6-carboxytetrahydropterin synthase [Nitrosopumilaceae archaeon]NIU87823.1 hypothetical protein [Nitrosopumilaceae archaeon]NIV65205.1 hypothetical protein [Nitrosopumilaceae archaeon]NIX61721.1 hypothetical protein [Nitrosopumilaceae archaeon]